MPRRPRGRRMLRAVRAAQRCRPNSRFPAARGIRRHAPGPHRGVRHARARGASDARGVADGHDHRGDDPAPAPSRFRATGRAGHDDRTERCPSASSAAHRPIWAGQSRDPGSRQSRVVVRPSMVKAVPQKGGPERAASWQADKRYREPGRRVKCGMRGAGRSPTAARRRWRPRRRVPNRARSGSSRERTRRRPFFATTRRTIPGKYERVDRVAIRPHRGTRRSDRRARFDRRRATRSARRHRAGARTHQMHSPRDADGL